MRVILCDSQYFRKIGSDEFDVVRKDREKRVGLESGADFQAVAVGFLLEQASKEVNGAQFCEQTVFLRPKRSRCLGVLASLHVVQGF